MTRNVCLRNECKKLKKKCYLYNYLVCFKENVPIAEMYSVLGSSPGISSLRSSRFGISNSSLWGEGHIRPLVQPPATHTGAVNKTKCPKILDKAFWRYIH